MNYFLFKSKYKMNYYEAMQLSILYHSAENIWNIAETTYDINETLQYINEQLREISKNY